LAAQPASLPKTTVHGPLAHMPNALRSVEVEGIVQLRTRRVTGTFVTAPSTRTSSAPV
jgi:hypothetical protein